MRVISETYNSHQYIISTHAPEVITLTNNRAFFVVKKSGYNSEVQTVDLRQRDNFQDVANLLGISMTDVFAADKIIWVEGPTEELCFPILYKAKGQQLPNGLIMSSVTTGDFNAKRRDRAVVYEIYAKLSTASASLTTSIAFSFDSENLNKTDKAQMVKESGEKLVFLPRRHFECYLLHPDAITHFLNSQEDDTHRTHQVHDVERGLRNLAGESRFSPENSWAGDLNDPNWLEKVDAAKLINECCNEMSETRVIFRKKRDTLTLLSFIIDRDRDFIEPAYVYVRDLVMRAGGE